MTTFETLMLMLTFGLLIVAMLSVSPKYKISAPLRYA